MAPDAKTRFYESVTYKKKVQAELFQRAKKLGECMMRECKKVSADITWLMNMKSESSALTDAQRVQKMQRLRGVLKGMEYSATRELSDCAVAKCEKASKDFFESKKNSLIADVDKAIALMEMMKDAQQANKSKKTANKKK